MASMAPTRRISWLLAGSIALAGACVLASLLIGTDQWAQWFAHPHRQPLPDSTRQGAVMWRTMLIVLAAAIVVVPLLLRWRCRPLEASSPRSAPLPARERWLLCGLVAVAFALRATRLGESLWYDEIVALGSFAIHGPGVIIANYYDPANHILHTLLTWVSMSMVEHAIGLELALRLPSLAASLASVAACHGLARVSHGPRVAVLAALLAAVLPIFVLEGAEARGYSMMILFSAGASWSLLAALRDDRPLQWIGYALLCALGAWAHPMTLFVPLGHSAWMAWMAIRDRSGHRIAAFALASSLAAILALTMYAPAIPDLIRLRTILVGSGSQQPTLLGPEGRHALLQLGGSWTWWAALPGLILAVLGFAAAVHWPVADDPNRPAQTVPSERDAMALMWLGLPLFVLAIWASGAWSYARFMLFALPAAVVTIAVGIDWLWRRRLSRGQRSEGRSQGVPNPDRKGIGVPRHGAAGFGRLDLWTFGCLSGLWILGWLAIGVPVIMSCLDLALLPAKQPLRDAADFIRSQSAAHESVLIIGLEHPVMDVYSERLHLSYTATLGTDLAQYLEGGLSTRPPRWIIVYYPNAAAPSTRDRIRRHGYVEVARFRGWVDWGGGDVVVYRAAM